MNHDVQYIQIIVSHVMCSTDMVSYVMCSVYRNPTHIPYVGISDLLLVVNMLGYIWQASSI